MVFDDNHERSPEPLNKAPEQSVSGAEKSSQVQADSSGNNQDKLDSGMTNHQEITTDSNDTHSVESIHNKQSPSEIVNDKQSLGEKSPDSISDKKVIESSNEEDKSPVLGLRFTGFISEQSPENKHNEKSDEDGDLLEDHLEYVANVTIYSMGAQIFMDLCVFLSMKNY